MKTVWKYTLRPERLSCAMPIGAEILTIHEQDGEVCLWALVEPQAEKEVRSFAVVGTGHPAPFHADEYLGSAFLHGGRLVFHVFGLRHKP